MKNLEHDTRLMNVGRLIDLFALHMHVMQEGDHVGFGGCVCGNTGSGGVGGGTWT